LNSWNVHYVADLCSMFDKGISFNWKVNTNECFVQAMFKGATSFDPNNWQKTDTETMRIMTDTQAYY